MNTFEQTYTNQTLNMRIRIPEEAAWILQVLHTHGYEAYVVGGCVRDVLLGRTPGDWDITTSALPQEVKALFPHTVDTGIQHGTVMVLRNGCGYEVTTYRIDGAYEDGRHPKNVTFTRSLEEDLKRRDFTINALAWGEDGLIDLFHGVDDLARGVIRCVGNPDLRFGEDALRIMRAVRFSAQLGFQIEEETGQMIRRHAPRLGDISMERIRTEWEKTLLSGHPTYVDLYRDYGIAPFIVNPGYEKCFSGESDELLTELHIRRRLPGSELSGDDNLYRGLMIAAFLWNLSDEEADQALRYLKYDNRTRRMVVRILRYREEPVTTDRVKIKQSMNRMGQEIWKALLILKDARGNEENCRAAEAVTRDILESGEPWTIGQLAVNGSDLMKAGIPAGKKLGEILEKILQKVMQSPTLNEKDILCRYAAELLLEVK